MLASLRKRALLGSAKEQLGAGTAALSEGIEFAESQMSSFGHDHREVQQE